MTKTSAIPAPQPAKHPVSTTIHGRTRVDEYAWMRDEAWREVMRDPSVLSASIREHLAAENAYVEALTEDTRALQDELFNEMRGRIKEDDSSTPARDGPFYYYSRFRTGGQYPIIARAPTAPDGSMQKDGEQILFDGDEEAGDATYFDIGAAGHSPDHKLFGYCVDRAGSERFELRIRNLETGQDLPDVIPDTGGAFVWANDSRTILWLERDENNRPCRVRRHVLGAPAEDAPIVYDEPDPGFFVSVGVTATDRFIVVDSHDHTTSEVYLIPADAPETPPRLVHPRERDLEYDVADHGERLYILTNADGAKDFKIMTAPLDAPGRENWRDWLAARDGVLVLGQELFARHHVRLERENGLPRLVLHRFSDGQEHAIALNEAAYSIGIGASYEFDTDVMRMAYASPATPDQVIDYDMQTRERTVLKTREVPSGHTPSDYVVERILAPAPDGEEVPITLVRRADAPRSPDAPLLLYGYGSYGITIPSDFRTSRLSLIDRGMTYAVAHVRGGMAKGYAWYENGKREHKRNTFTDYLACAHALIARGDTSPGRIVAMGGSAGGLLVGAAVNMEPELFAGVVAAVPFVDVVNTMSDESLPLTPPEWPEWGNPLEDAAAYEMMASYCPYQNVSELAYPPILATAGLSDPRVTYWEPAKWIARLRDRSLSGAPMMLKTNMEAGHGGATGRWDSLREVAFEYAFALSVVGAPDAPGRALRARASPQSSS